MNMQDQMQVKVGKRLSLYAEVPSLNEICVNSVAFANQAGGEIAIGVNPDTLEILGINDQEIYAALVKIPHAIENKCSPNIVPEVFVRNVGGRHILMVRIAAGSMKPYYIREEGDLKGVYVRQSKMNRHASRQQIEELVRQSRNQSFDEIMMSDCKLEDLDLAGLKEDVHRLVHMELSDTDLLRLGLLDRSTPTRALAILVGDERWFGYAKLVCTRHRISPSGGFEEESEEMTGSLPRRVASAIDFLTEMPDFCGHKIPRKLLLETIVNAVVHRDYAMKADAVKIDVFPDRIILSSPGGLPGTVTIAQLREGISQSRNPLIANFMRVIGFAGSWGTGIPRIFEVCMEEGLFTPELKANGDFFQVIIDRCSN